MNCVLCSLTFRHYMEVNRHWTTRFINNN